MGKSSTLAKVVLWALMVISIVVFIIMVLSIDSETSPGENARNMMALNINWAIALFIIAGVVSLVFALIQIINDKTKAINALVVLLIMGAIVGISYGVSSNEIPNFFGVQKFVADGSLTPVIARWVDTGLYATYILSLGAILSIVGFGVSGIFKRS